MYTGFLLTSESKEKLLVLYPPKYPDFIGHHITEHFGGKSPKAPPEPNEVLVLGHIDNGEDVEGFIVSVDGNTNRQSGGKYHITWSIDRSKGASPVHTNQYIDMAKYFKVPIEIYVEPKIFR